MELNIYCLNLLEVVTLTPSYAPRMHAITPIS